MQKGTIDVSSRSRAASAQPLVTVAAFGRHSPMLAQLPFTCTDAGAA
jgi:hypothetical protein